MPVDYVDRLISKAKRRRLEEQFDRVRCRSRLLIGGSRLEVVGLRDSQGPRVEADRTQPDGDAFHLQALNLTCSSINALCKVHSCSGIDPFHDWASLKPFSNLIV
jgi:hypothetical protein